MQNSHKIGFVLTDTAPNEDEQFSNAIYQVRLVCLSLQF